MQIVFVYLIIFSNLFLQYLVGLMYCIVSVFFRSEVVRVLTDVEIPGKVTEFQDMGGLGS